MSQKLCVVLGLLLALVPACLAQQESGDSEFAFTAALIVPHASAGDANGVVVPRYGKFLSEKNQIGFAAFVFLSSESTAYSPTVFYRRFLGSSGSKVQPFVGAGGGVFGVTGGDGTTNGLANGDFGMKFFLSEKTAFDITYSLQYVSGGDGGFKDSSGSLVLFGFSYLF